MPLAQLVQGGAAAAAASGGRPPKRPRQRAPQQQDVCTLLVHVLLGVQQGQPLCLETVKAAWRALTFSHVFEVRGWNRLLLFDPAHEAAPQAPCKCRPVPKSAALLLTTSQCTSARLPAAAHLLLPLLECRSTAPT